MITNMQVIAPMEDLKALIDAVDVNQNGTIDCRELVGLIEKTINESFSRLDVTRIGAGQRQKIILFALSLPRAYMGL